MYPTHILMPSVLNPAILYFANLGYIPKNVPLSCIIDSGTEYKAITISAKYIKPYIITRNNHVAIVSWITIVIFLFGGIIVGYLSPGDTGFGDNEWIISSILVLLYISLFVVVHGYLYEVVKTSDKAERQGQGSFVSSLMRAVPLLRYIFPMEPTVSDPTNAEKHASVASEVGILATTKLGPIPLDGSSPNNPSQSADAFIKPSFSWVVDARAGTEKDATGFERVETGNFAAGSVVSKGLADVKYAINDMANTISNGIRGTHVQLRDEEENPLAARDEEQEVSFVVE
ncbi:hypothetical protein HDU98_005567 [Podochytrium sp. JEL0797]|nr:hypothetical protein HDU98_005567 [Podochytrium sp. JEL0797]